MPQISLSISSRMLHKRDMVLWFIAELWVRMAIFSTPSSLQEVMLFLRMLQELAITTPFLAWNYPLQQRRWN